MKAKPLLSCSIGVSVILLVSACGHKEVMNKSQAEKALRVFDSELLGTAAGISQTDGWAVFMGLLRSDSLPFEGDGTISDRLPHDLPFANSFIQSVLNKFPLNFRQDYFKNGKKICSVNSYFKPKPDSSFYIRNLIFIKPCCLEMRCLYTKGQLHHTYRLNLVFSIRDTTGTFLDGRIRADILRPDKGFMQITTMHAEVKFFDLFFSGNGDFSGLKPGTNDSYHFISAGNLKVYDYASSRYIGRLEYAGKDNKKKADLIFVFSDGSIKPASACFSIYSMLGSKD
ncbi:MAG: hypothetical protein WCK92_06390 [Bacteroidota bacterium]